MSTDYCQDRIQLQDLMLHYATAVDERDIERYRDCFAENVEVVGFGAGPIHGRQAWLDYVWSTLEKYSSTQHLLGPQLATVDGDFASTRSDVQAMHELADASGRFILWATYQTNMQRIDGQWKISRHEIVARSTKTL